MRKYLMILLLIHFACAREPIPDQYHHYIGTWSGDRGSQMIINEDGSGKLVFVSFDASSNRQVLTINSATVTINEPVIRFSGALGIFHDMIMQKLPWYSNSKWWTIIDSETYSHGF